MTLRLGILGSTRGTNMLSLIDAINQHQLDARIIKVISNKKDALILSRARDNQLEAEYIPVGNASRDEYDTIITESLTKARVDLVVLIGYMRILSKSFVEHWQNKIINVHPSLLPNFAGLMDLEVHKAVINSGVKETGCSIHFVTEDVDAGPIVLQKKCPVFDNDTPEILKQRVQGLESKALIESISVLNN